MSEALLGLIALAGVLQTLFIVPFDRNADRGVVNLVDGFELFANRRAE